MKQINNNLKNIYFKLLNFLKIKNLSAQEKSKTELSPLYYWKIILFVFLFLFLFSFLANSLFFWYLNKAGVMKENNKTESKKDIKKNDLSEIIDKLNKKRAIFQEILISPPDINEP